LPAALALIGFGLFLLAGCKGGGASSITVQIEPSTSPSVDEGQPFNFKATLSNDVTDKGVTWSLTQSGTGCSGAGCGTLQSAAPFSVTYLAPPVGTFSATTSVTLTAKAVAKTSATATATISVAIPPTFTTTTLANGANGVPYRQAITVTGGVAPLTFKLTSGSLPAGLTLNPSGTIVGTPSSSGTSNFTVTATDNGSSPLPVSQPFTLRVTPAPALAIATTTLPSGSVNAKYSAVISATGGVLPLAWTTSSGALPPGLVLGPNSGQISGTPAALGTYPFTVQAKDSSLPSPGQTAQAALSITIAQPAPLAITTTSLPIATTATAYTAALIATGGIAPYTWGVSTGQLPPGLTLAQDGTISGTPVLATTVPDQFTVQVTDSGVIPSTLTQSLSLTVAAGTTGNTLLNGQYAFLFRGFDSGGPVAIAGSLIADGNGHITVGAEDSNRASGVVNGITLTGIYSIGSDGRGTLELIATNPTTGVKLTSDYQFVLDSIGNARFVQNNTTSTNSDTLGTHGQGTLKLVAGTASSSSTTTFTSTFSAGSLNGNYAFGLSGRDLSGKPAALIGEVHADGASTLVPSGNGVNSDYNDAGVYSSQPLTGGFSVGSNYNRGTAQLVFAPPSGAPVHLGFTFYFVSPTDLYFVEIDTRSTATVFDRLSGEMILQQPTSQFDAASLAGVNVVTGAGVNGSNATVLAGVLTSTAGDGNATLVYDEDNGGTVTTPAPTFSGTYMVAGNGRASFAGLAAARVAAAYLTGPGQGFLLGSDAAVTVGRLEQQTGSAPFALSSFEGNYAASAERPAENLAPNLVGEVDASGAGAVTGTIDEIDPPTAATPKGKANLDQSLVANANVSSNGRGTMTANPLLGFPVQLVFYVVSPGHVRAIPADSNPGNGHPEVIFFDH
jgi:Putative Ig domain